MRTAAEGWVEPGQRPEFEELTLVLDGCLRVEHEGGALDVRAGQTTRDIRFTLEAVRCLGCCGLAPVVTVNDDVYGKITSQRMVEVLEQYPA